MHSDREMLFLKKKCLIFDFDGTIADSFILHEQAFQEALVKHNLLFNYADYLGRSTQEAIREIFIENDLQIEDDLLKILTAEKRRIANALYNSSLRFIDGAEEFIRKAYETGFELSIASSGSMQNVTTGIKVLGISPYFKSVVTADDVILSKPNPEIFETALRQLKHEPSAALVLEDAVSGLRAANAAGIDVVCVDKSIQCDFEQLKVKLYLLNFQDLLKKLLDEYCV